MFGKTPEELKLIKQMRQKLSTTTIPKLPFELDSSSTRYFEDYYDYLKPLGCGAFGFVVSAIDKSSGEELALKVTINRLIFSFLQIVDTNIESSVNCIRKEAKILESLGSHPYVIRFRHVSHREEIIQIREYQNYIVLAIENARGGTLSDLIKR